MNGALGTVLRCLDLCKLQAVPGGNGLKLGRDVIILWVEEEAINEGGQNLSARVLGLLPTSSPTLNNQEPKFLLSELERGF